MDLTGASKLVKDDSDFHKLAQNSSLYFKFQMTIVKEKKSYFHK
jgi:hypothetical protein